MQVILSAQDQKDLHYEVECILRMFLPQVRLRFCQEPEAGERESVRITTGGGEGLENTVSLTLGDFSGTGRTPKPRFAGASTGCWPVLLARGYLGGCLPASAR